MAFMVNYSRFITLVGGTNFSNWVARSELQAKGVIECSNHALRLKLRTCHPLHAMLTLCWYGNLFLQPENDLSFRIAAYVAIVVHLQGGFCGARVSTGLVGPGNDKRRVGSCHLPDRAPDETRPSPLIATVVWSA